MDLLIPILAGGYFGFTVTTLLEEFFRIGEPPEFFRIGAPEKKEPIKVGHWLVILFFRSLLILVLSTVIYSDSLVAKGVAIFYIILIVVGSIHDVLLIGKKREPEKRTAGMFVVVLIFMLPLLWLLLMIATAPIRQSLSDPKPPPIQQPSYSIQEDAQGDLRCWCGALIVMGDGGKDGSSTRVICQRGHITGGITR